MQHHVQYNAIGLEAHAVQGIGQLQADVTQHLPFAHFARQFEHRLAVVQRCDLGEAARQLRQKSAVSGADFNSCSAFAETQLVEQGHHAFAVLRQAGDQVLLGAKLLRDP
ncbi:hypothetical protein D3C81_1315180 [compost metagenome]